MHSISFLFKSIGIRGEAEAVHRPGKETVPALLKWGPWFKTRIQEGEGLAEIDGRSPDGRLARGVCVCNLEWGVVGWACAQPSSGACHPDSLDPLPMEIVHPSLFAEETRTRGVT